MSPSDTKEHIMEEFILTKPTNEYAEEISRYRDEFLASGESMDGTGPLSKIEDPFRYVEICSEWERPETVPTGLVPATQFMLVRASDNHVVGMIQVRHMFNSFLSKFGGHIGYSVCPSERGKGYASLMLKKVLPYCKQVGIDKLLVTCLEDNIASEKTIRKCGGIYESTIHEPHGGVNLKRFWIDLD